MQRRLAYIINPISGTKNKDSLKELIAVKTEAAGFPFDFFPSVASGDYSFLFPIIQETGITDVIIAGGDGTINSVVNGLKHLNVQFGILPLGSGNGLAFSAHIPKKIDKALDIVFEGKAEWTDAFTINDRFACMLCGLGFDAQVAHDFANDPKRGLATYIRKTVSNFFSAKAYPFQIKTGEKQIDTEAFFISIANSNQFGNNFTIAPKASLTDGLLDVVIVAKQNKLSVLWNTLKQVGGFNTVKEIDQLNDNASLLYFQTDALLIDNPASAPMHIDGDPSESFEKLSISVVPKCFRLIYP
jgi:diacylglycerol kinase (ATP)